MGRRHGSVGATGSEGGSSTVDLEARRPISHFVFGANTDIGKTVLTAALVSAAASTRRGGGRGHAEASDGPSTAARHAAHYVKPLQCGGSDEAFVRRHAAPAVAGGGTARTLFAWRTPASPHVAARIEDRPASDDEVRAALVATLAALDEGAQGGSGGDSAWIETAGGVLSPAAASPRNAGPRHARDRAAGGWGWTTQADLYAPLRRRAAALLVGDGRLGGIAATLAALEALLRRGYDVGGILLLRDPDGAGVPGGGDEDGGDVNRDALREYAACLAGTPAAGEASRGLFADPARSIVSLPAPPPEPEPLFDWYASREVREPMKEFVHDHLFVHGRRQYDGNGQGSST